MTRSTAPLALLASLASLVLSGCAGGPALTTSVSGAVPVGRSFTPVAAAKYYGSDGQPMAPLEACLGRGGMVAAVAGHNDTLLQIASTLRPARSRVITGDEAPGKRRRPPARGQEELVLAVTDATSGALLLRASATQVLGKGQAAAADGVLAGALCAALLNQPKVATAG